MIDFPNAKINLGLQVLSKRLDNYHNIASVFYPIPWQDVLEILPAKETMFTVTGLAVPGNTADNLILKAFSVFKEYTSLHVEAHLHLHKVIPMGAGLGGGSADAAFTLSLLNKVFEANLNTEELENLARKLGSDCPFFIRNKPAFCFNTGTDLEPFELDLKGLYIFCVYPNLHVPTAAAYAGIKPFEPELSPKDILKMPKSEWRKFLKNDFEESVAKNYPIVNDIKEKLYKNGAFYAAMSGSGSTVFGLFEKEPLLDFSDHVIFTSKL